MPKTPVAKKTSTSTRKTSTRKTSSPKASTHKASTQKASTAKVGSRFVVPGTERRALPGARAAAPVLPDERIEVSVRVRPKPGARDLDAGGALADQPPAERRYLSRDEFAARHGAEPGDMAKVAAFADGARARGRGIERGTAQRRAVRQRRRDERRVRRRRSSITSTTAAPTAAAPGASIVPATSPASSRACSGSTTGRRPRRTSRCSAPRRRGRTRTRRLVHAAAARRALRFPDGLDGTGQCIGIIELGGGFKPADIAAYFSRPRLPVPDVRAISVDGGKNRPTQRRTAPTAR